MNRRQKDILHMLIKNEKKPLLILNIAEEVGCSEKTVRNDLREMEAQLKEYPTATIIRKPGIGIYLEIEASEKKSLLQHLHGSEHTPKEQVEQERMFQIGYELLMSIKPITIQALADKYFINKAIIKKELLELEKWFEKGSLTLITKQRVGVSVAGTEKAKRRALTKIEEQLREVVSLEEFLKKKFSFHEIMIVKNELQEWQKKYSLYFTDDTLERLLIHILFTMKRMRLKQYITVSEQEKALVMGKNEYHWTAALLKKLEGYFVLTFPEEEMIYLTIHMLGGKLRPNSDVSNETVYPFIEELVKGMSVYMEMDLMEETSLLEGLHIHLYSAFHRIQSELTVPNPMLADIKKMYPYVFHHVMNVLEEMEDPFAKLIPEEEVAYLVLHFQAAIERSHREKEQRKKAIIVCHLGVGMSQLLYIKLERKFRSLHLLGHIAKAEVKDYLKNHHVDFIISTVPLPSFSVPTMVVSPLLGADDEEKLTEFLGNDEKRNVENNLESVLLKYTTPSLLFLQLEPMHREELIKELGTALFYQGYVEEGYIESIVTRERLSATTIGSGIAIPHGNPSFVKKSVLAIATLTEPIEWGDEKVSLVFMMALGNEAGRDTKQLFKVLSFFTENVSLIQPLLQETNKENFLQHLINGK